MNSNMKKVDHLRRRRTVKVVVLFGVILTHLALLGSVILDKRAIQTTARTIAPADADEQTTIETLTRHVHDELYHCNRDDVMQMPLLRRWNYLYNPFRIGPKTALEFGAHHTGACGSSSRVLMELLSTYHIPSRFVILLDDQLRSRHTLLEVFYNDDAWGAVDPLYGIVYQHPDGRPASMWELRNDAELFRNNAEQGWEYGYGPEGKFQTHPYNLEKYPFRNATYLNYSKFGAIGRGLHGFLGATFGEPATLWIRRPNAYAYPALTTLILLDGTLLCLGIAWWIAVRIRSVRRGPRSPRANNGPSIA